MNAAEIIYACHACGCTSVSFTRPIEETGEYDGVCDRCGSLDIDELEEEVKAIAGLKGATPHQVVAVMDEAAEIARTLMAQIDECPEAEIPTALAQAFKISELAKTEAVDRVKALAAELKAQEQKVQAAIAALEKHGERIGFIREWVSDEVRAQIEARPDVLYRDSYGRKLSVGSNGGVPSLKTEGISLGKKHVSNVLDVEALEMVPAKYVKQVSFLTLDTEAIRADIEGGEDVGFAKLERGKRVYGL